MRYLSCVGRYVVDSLLRGFSLFLPHIEDGKLNTEQSQNEKPSFGREKLIYTNHFG
jgi:hypothetical protein